MRKRRPTARISTGSTIWRSTGYTERSYFPNTPQRMEAYVRHARLHQDRILLGVFDDATKRHIGNITFDEIDYINGRAAIACLLGDDTFAGKGIMTEAMLMMMSYGFNKLNLHRIFAGVASMNPASQKMCEKAGLLVEGCQRQHLLRNGERHDRILMGALRPEWIQSHDRSVGPGLFRCAAHVTRRVTPATKPAGPETVVALVAHDAGGAEILSSYALQQGASSFLYTLQDPAAGIFSRKLGAVEVLDVHAAVSRADVVICGTSWQSDLEVRAIRLAKTLGKRSIAFLDHWTNYRERFVRSGDVVLPDEMWVGDTMAEQMAVATFPGIPVHVRDDPYLLDVQRTLREAMAAVVRVSPGLTVLYVSEPLREHGRLQFANERHWGYVEEEALRYFLDHVSVMDGAITQIVIRAHPSEPPDKYQWALREYSLPIAAGGARTLVEEVANADVVVGCESMALVVGLLAGKRVISCVPPGGKACALPHPQILHYQQLLERRMDR